MNDLRYDQEAADATTHARLRMNAAELRTVPMPKPTEAFAAIRAKFGEHFDAMDPDAHAADPRYNLVSEPLPSNNAVWAGAIATSGVDTVYDPRVLPAASLRTVPMPDLRSAAARELPPLTYAERNDARFDALWLAVQTLTARVEVLEQGRDPAQSDVWEVVALERRISTLEARLTALEQAGKPLVMAEDAWGGVG